MAAEDVPAEVEGISVSSFGSVSFAFLEMPLRKSSTSIIFSGPNVLSASIDRLIEVKNNKEGYFTVKTIVKTHTFEQSLVLFREV